MRYLFQRDIYDTLDEFIKEYSNDYNEDGENSRGMDFLYKGFNYRICREYDEVYYLYNVIENKNDNEFIIVKVYNSMIELLNSKEIDNRLFSEIIMDEENTIIYGKD